jgi:uncharacterized membrane protein
MMAHTHPPYTAAIAGQSIYSTLVQFPVVCFTLTLLTDLAYWQTENLMWHNFSSWLLFAGLVFGAVAAIVGIIEFLLSSRMRARGPVWPHVISSLIVLALAFFNSLVHAGDGWTGVVPWGLTLSAVTVVLMIVNGWLSRAPIAHYRVGVTDHD